RPDNQRTSNAQRRTSNAECCAKASTTVIPNEVRDLAYEAGFTSGQQRGHSACERSFAQLGMTSRAVVCPTRREKIRLSMRERKKRRVLVRQYSFFTLSFLVAASSSAVTRPTKTTSPKAGLSSAATKKSGRQDDSLYLKPAADLGLRVAGAHKADALTHFVEGMALEENRQMRRAVAGHPNALHVPPCQAQLPAQVGALP